MVATLFIPFQNAAKTKQKLKFTASLIPVTKAPCGLFFHHFVVDCINNHRSFLIFLLTLSMI